MLTHFYIKLIQTVTYLSKKSTEGASVTTSSRQRSY